MAYDEYLGERIAMILREKRVRYEAKKMMGGIDLDEDLEYWIRVCLDFNPKAKSSKKPSPANRPGSVAKKGRNKKS